MTAPFIAARRKLEEHGRPEVDKVVSAAEAAALVKDGDHVAIGGTLYSRTPTVLLFELLRQRRRGLTLSRPLTCYEADLFFATEAADRIVTSWVGIGLRWGLSATVRHYVENGLAAYDEWSHLGIGLGYKAGGMGVPFLPTLSMLGSDLAQQRNITTVQCPYTQETLLAVPALIPDVTILHVHRADKFGNAQVDGYRHMDVDMARAATRVVVTTERVVSHEEIASSPSDTMLPHFVVDAVVEAPYGAYPSEVYGLYEPDLAHFERYVELVRANGVDGVREYVEHNVMGHPDFAAFLADVGEERLAELAAAAKGLVP